MRLMTLALAFASLSACVVYDEELVHEDTGADELPDRSGQDNDDPQLLAISVVPSGALLGERALISLYGSADVDLEDIVEVTFLGDSELTIRSFASRSASEYLLAVDIPENSALTSNHLLLGMADGTTLFIEDAFTVASEAAFLPQSPKPPTCR